MSEAEANKSTDSGAMPGDHRLPGAAVLPHPLPPGRGTPALAGDILAGADAIAEFIFGDRRHRRKVYNLVETGRLPIFRLGINICARKSVLIGWIERQESQPVAARANSEGDVRVPDAPAG